MIEPVAPRSLKAIADLQTPCKICGTGSPLFDVVDFHEDCHETDGRRMALSGIPVYYYRCAGCGFLFTRQFDDAEATDFAISVQIAEDPHSNRDPAERHARSDLALLRDWFGEELNALRILVLGNVRLAALLREAGCMADSQGQRAAGARTLLSSPDSRYDMILAFDILEQVADPTTMMQQIDRSMVPDGLLLLSTRLSDGNDTVATGIRRRPLRFVSPRLGQISIYNACSLALILGTAGFRLAGTKQGIHIGLRALPAFAQHLFQDRSGWRLPKTLFGLR